MKKIIAVLLAALFALSLVSCGAGDAPDASQDAVGETTTEAAEAVKVSRGVITGDAYVNEFAGFTFTKPADWNFLTDEEIANTVDIGQAELDLNAIQEALAEKASIYDMAAKSPTGESVMLVYENTMLTAFRKLTADEYIDGLKTQLLSVSSIQYTIGEVEDITLGSTQYKKLTVSGVMSGVEMKQTYYVRAVDSYVIGVIATAFSDAEILTIEAMFS